MAPMIVFDQPMRMLLIFVFNSAYDDELFNESDVMIPSWMTITLSSSNSEVSLISFLSGTTFISSFEYDLSLLNSSTTALIFVDDDLKSYP